ncbi:hypothetical protein FPRO05_12237 [Fusarium proliferatum]|uniref:Uncharacterized protein n=1 Tax=Gibberella intermedia TaxID=948311 RepID=A0A365N481_GIBIN|nr:hypothetical protein FPRO05_12237 [Fusarium proliferatum]
MAKTIILITGANKGLGYHVAADLLTSPDNHVILACRNPKSGTEALGNLTSLASTRGTASVVALDITSDVSVKNAVDVVKKDFPHLDVLINNAGICVEPLGVKSPPLAEGLLTSFSTNVVGTARVTDAFVPLLSNSATKRIIFITSGSASLTYASDPTSHHHGPYMDAYRVSKTALNMLLVQYTTRFKGTGMVILGVNPGFCATDISGDPKIVLELGGIEPQEGAQIIAGAARGEKDDFAGKVVDANGIVAW